jgi:flagellar hook-basal body complex protein FliE
MSNMSIDSFELGGRAAQITGGESVTGPAGRVSEKNVIAEMRNQGMETPQADFGVGSFSHLLRKSVEQVNQDQQQADVAIKELISGRSKNIHETMLIIERADTSLKLMTQVRNKILDAYKEIMRMQV